MKKNLYFFFLGPILTGLLIAIAFSPFHLGFLAWFSLVPWLLTLRKVKTWKEALISGWITCITMQLFVSYGLISGFHYSVHLNWFLSFLGYLIFSFTSQPQFVAFSLVYYFLAKRKFFNPWLEPLIFSLLYAVLDWFLPKIFSDTIAHTQYRYPILVQICEYTGAYGLSVIVFLVNYAFVVLFENRDQKNLKSVVPASALALIAFVFVTTFGAYKISSENNVGIGEQSIKVLIVQGNPSLENLIKAEQGDPRANVSLLENHIQLTESTLKTFQADLVIWPEAVFRNMPNVNTDILKTELNRRMDLFFQNYKGSLIFGGFSKADHGRAYNTFYTASGATPDWKASFQEYRKQKLFPFGEYLPMEDYFPWVRKILPGAGSLLRNQEDRFTQNHILNIPSKNLSIEIIPLICYEVLFPAYVKQRIKQQNQQILINITNDSWFGDFGLPDIHFALAAFRAIDNRTPYLRASMRGPSAYIDHQGKMVQDTKINTQGVLKIELPIQSSN